MKDGIHLVYCSRPGCGKELGAVKVLGGKVVECEFPQPIRQEPDTATFYCKECYPVKGDFVTPEEIEDGDVC